MMVAQQNPNSTSNESDESISVSEQINDLILKQEPMAFALRHLAEQIGTLIGSNPEAAALRRELETLSSLADDVMDGLCHLWEDPSFYDYYITLGDDGGEMDDSELEALLVALG